MAAWPCDSRGRNDSETAWPTMSATICTRASARLTWIIRILDSIRVRCAHSMGGWYESATDPGIHVHGRAGCWLHPSRRACGQAKPSARCGVVPGRSGPCPTRQRRARFHLHRQQQRNRVRLHEGRDIGPAVVQRATRAVQKAGRGIRVQHGRRHGSLQLCIHASPSERRRREACAGTHPIVRAAASARPSPLSLGPLPR